MWPSPRGENHRGRGIAEPQRKPWEGCGQASEEETMGEGHGRALEKTIGRGVAKPQEEIKLWGRGVAKPQRRKP